MPSAIDPPPESTEAERDLARRSAAAMWASDQVAQTMGMRLEEMGPGYARISMRVRKDMLNGFATCHGGIMFTLADSAFAFSCNSRNEATVAASCSVDFLRQVREHEQLTAISRERLLSGRTGIYDVTVIDEAGQPVALFRGKSARVKGEVIGPSAARAG
ncbi:MAG: hydroxyphenylacetyl-CoA thioesterase PaaI [Panacagrimonas sp.]